MGLYIPADCPLFSIGCFIMKEETPRRRWRGPYACGRGVRRFARFLVIGLSSRPTCRRRSRSTSTEHRRTGDPRGGPNASSRPGTSCADPRWSAAPAILPATGAAQDGWFQWMDRTCCGWNSSAAHDLVFPSILVGRSRAWNPPLWCPCSRITRQFEEAQAALLLLQLTTHKPPT